MEFLEQAEKAHAKKEFDNAASGYTKAIEHLMKEFHEFYHDLDVDEPKQTGRSYRLVSCIERDLIKASTCRGEIHLQQFKTYDLALADFTFAILHSVSENPRLFWLRAQTLKALNLPVAARVDMDMIRQHYDTLKRHNHGRLSEEDEADLKRFTD